MDVDQVEPASGYHGQRDRPNDIERFHPARTGFRPCRKILPARLLDRGQDSRDDIDVLRVAHRQALVTQASDALESRVEKPIITGITADDLRLLPFAGHEKFE